MTRPTPTTEETAYLWENIPKPLWQAAREKALREQTSMKAVLEKLLREWLGATGMKPYIHVAGKWDPEKQEQRCTRCGEVLADINIEGWKYLWYPEDVLVEKTPTYQCIYLGVVGPNCVPL